MAAETINYAIQPLLPKDRDSIPIQVLSVDDTTVVQTNIATGNNRVALPADSEVVEIAASDLCRVAFGNSAVDVTSGTRRIFPAGTAVYRIPTGATHIAVTQVGASTGVVTVTRMF